MNETAQIQILQTSPDEDEIHIKDYIAVLKRGWWMIMLSFIVVVGLTILYIIKTPRQYTATAVIKLPSSESKGMISALGSLLPSMKGTDISTEIEIIKGKDIAESVIGELELGKREQNSEIELPMLVMKFQKMLKVTQKGKANLIDVNATDISPKYAMDIANKAAEEYIKKTDMSNLKSWNDLIEKMEAKLIQTKNDLEKSRNLLHEYEAQKGITTAFSPLLVGGGTSISGSGTQYMVPEVPQAVAELKARTIQMEIQLDEMRKYFPESNPEIIKLKNQISENRQKLQQEESKVIDKYNKQFGLTKLAAEVIFNQQVFSTLISKQEELKAQYIMQNKPPEMAERAELPIFPSAPKRKLILMVGTMLGVFLGLGLTILREFLDSSIHSSDEAKKALDIQVLGSIPKLKKARNQPLLLIDHDSNNRNFWVERLYRESFRIIQLDVMNKAKHAIMVTSPLPDEGKSLIAANLAISVAQMGKKVLLISVKAQEKASDVFSVLVGNHRRDGADLVNVLFGKLGLEDAFVSTTVNNLYILLAGNQEGYDLSSLILSSRMDDFISLAKSSFDFVIFDAPPVALASEAVAIGSKVDGTILVIKANSTLKDNVIRAKETIQNSGAEIIGVVINQVSPDKRFRKLYK